MPLMKLLFQPGINREVTRYSEEGGWYTCDKVRFRKGFPETIGGWAKYSSNAFLGVARSMYAFFSLSGSVYVGVGTHLKYYILDGGTYNDITPIRETTAAGDVTFSASNGSTTLTVTDASHGAMLGDFVTYSGAATLGGTVTAGVLNAEHQIATIVGANSYTVELAAAANASDTGNGGASVIGAYQINSGANAVILGTGWGADPWSDGAWGEAGAASLEIGTLRIWSQDNFGEDLVMNSANGGIFYWDTSDGTVARAVALSSLAGSNTAPTVARRVLVSDQDRHIIAFGCDGEFTIGTQDPLLIRWCDQENAAEWASTATTTAGSLRLSSGTKIITAMQTKREIIVFTDAALYSMQYLGPPYTFGVNEVSRSVQIVGQEAAVAVDDVLYWMANGAFMQYDGSAREITCSVEDYVFSGINREELERVVAGHNKQFSEVWWFYPSGTNTENDSYVVYNYEQDIWYIGEMVRTAWLSSGVISRPLAATPDGYLYEHETGMNDGESNPPVGIDAYIESTAMDIGDGDSFFFARRVIPDLTFRESTGSPTATMTFKARNFPGAGFDVEDAEDVTQSVASPVEKYTNQLHIRLRGRTLGVRIESDGENTAWRLGAPRIDIRTDGKR